MLHNWSSSALRAFLLLTFFAISTSAFTPDKASAQWVQRYGFGTGVTSIYFMPFAGNELKGFVGLDNGEIYLTQNEGTNWDPAVTPATTGAITGITFKDENIGWASFSDQTKEAGGVLQTLDGGLTWTVQTAEPSFNILAIYYHAPLSTLYISPYRTGGTPQPIRRSVDDGANWTDVVSSHNRMRYSFWDGNNGLVGNTNAGSGDKQFSRTIDGGATWTDVTLDTSTIMYTAQPLAIPGTKLGFAIVTYLDNLVYRTTDQGVTWKRVGSFPKAPWHPTTHLEYTCGLLWAQGQDAVYYSSNQGESWINFSGPGNGIFGKHMDLSMTQIWAADENNYLHSAPKPQSPNSTRLRLDRRNLRMNSTKCDPIDSTMWLSLMNFCDQFVITGLQMSGSNEVTPKNFPALPYPLSGRDSLAFTFASLDFDRDSAFVKVSYTVGGVPYDTTILIIAERTRAFNAALSFTSMKREILQPCVGLDTTFSITNTPCDQLRILSARLTDSSIFRIQNPPLPLDLPPDGVGSIRITAASSVQGTYTSKLLVRFEYAGQIFDTVIALEYKVRTGPLAPIIPPMNFVLDNPCTKLDTVIRWVNRLCGELRLDSVMIEPNKGVTFRGPDPIPGQPTEIIRYPITIQGAAKGKYTAKVKLSFTDHTGASFDTTITITYEVKNLPPTRLNTPPSFVFRSTSICAPREQTLYIENTLCDPITLTGQSWITTNPMITVVSAPAYPVPLAPGAKDSIVLRFAPTAAGNQSAPLRIDYTVYSTSQFSQINVTGIGTTQANAVLSDDLLVFDSAYSCEAVPERFTHITNEGCDSIVITNLSQLAGGQFELLEPTIPFTLGPGDSVKLVLRPRNRTGRLSDSVDLLFRSLLGGADQAARLRLEGFTRPPVRLVEMETSFAFDSIAPCSSVDTIIRIYNNGICDTLTINNVGVTGLAAITATGTTPARIAPGEYYEVVIRMNTGTGGVNGIATIRLTGNIDTTFTVRMSTSSGGGTGESTLTMDIPDSTFTVAPCGTQSRTFTMTAQGCGDFTIGRVVIESTFPGQTQFTVTGTTPQVLQPGGQASYVVSFDASGNGDLQAELVIESADGKFVRRIPLTATVTGSTGVLSLRLEGEGGANAFTKKVGETVSVQVFANQNVDPGHQLSAVAVDLAYDIDLMSSTASNGSGGWNINAQSTTTGTRLVFTKDPTSPHDMAQPLGQVQYTVRLAEEVSTQLTMSDPTLNGGDPDYARCIMRPLASSGTVDVSVSDVCYDSTIRNAMAGRAFVTIIGIRPSTLLSSSSLSGVAIEYVLAAESSVMISIQDQLGRIVAQQTTERSAGSHSELLRLPAVEGMYFVTLHAANGGTATRKIVVE